MLSVVLAGCYTLQPVGTAAAPVPGTEVAFEVTDAGRVALGQLVGPEILQLQGRLVSAENGDYVLAVNTVRFVRGGEHVWNGEHVRVGSAHISRTYERRFSKGRTATVAAVTVGGIAAFFLTRSLIAAGSEPGDTGRPDEPGTSFTRPPAGTRP